MAIEPADVAGSSPPEKKYSTPDDRKIHYLTDLDPEDQKKMEQQQGISFMQKYKKTCEAAAKKRKDDEKQAKDA